MATWNVSIKVLARLLWSMTLAVSCGKLEKSKNADTLAPEEPTAAELEERRSRELDDEAQKTFNCSTAATEPLSNDSDFKKKKDNVSEIGTVKLTDDGSEVLYSINQPKYPQLKDLCVKLTGTGYRATFSIRRSLDFLEIVEAGSNNDITIDMTTDTTVNKFRLKLVGSSARITIKGANSDFCNTILYSDTGARNSVTCNDRDLSGI